MADQQIPANGDLVNLDQATEQSSHDSGMGLTGQDSILNAAEVFQRQLDQLTAWKQQLAQQMDIMRRDTLRLVERQKALAQERKDLAQERVSIESDRASVQKLREEAEAQSVRLTRQAGELENAQRELQELQRQRQQAEMELAAREKSLQEQKGHQLAEDLRLKEGLTQLEEQRRQLAESRDQTMQEQETLAARLRELDERADALDKQGRTLNARQQEVESAARQIESESLSLRTREQGLTQQREALESGLAELKSGEQRLAEERQAVSRLRQEVHRKLESVEREHAEQLESMAREAKRLAERRGEVEASQADLDNALASRIADATEAFKKELAQTSEHYQQQLAELRDTLGATQASLEKVSGERAEIAQQLAAQVEEARQETARWQQAVDEARTQSTGSDQVLAGIRNELQAARSELEAAMSRTAQIQSAKDELEFQLEVRAEEHARQMASLKQELTGGAADSATVQELRLRVEECEKQRDELASQLYASQDNLRHQQEESAAVKCALETRILDLETAPPDQPANAKAANWHRQRLLRQAKSLRTFRQQIRDTQAALETGRAEIAQQREQMRARRENLEQVKRLLEKQEIVMARKLADHNAIKTVAAVGIFVIMVLGSVFLGVYRFIEPLYRSEVVVQLAPPPELAEAQLEGWLEAQQQFITSQENTFAAWKILRSPDEQYAMHDVREAWLGSLGDLQTQLDTPTRTLTLRYSGPQSEGVAQVCNALAYAYGTPGIRESTEATHTLGLGSQVLAKAIAPLYPVEDNRLMTSLSIVAIVLFLSLIMIMVFRYFIARQLREIDQMADGKDLDDIRTELPESPAPIAAE